MAAPQDCRAVRDVGLLLWHSTGKSTAAFLGKLRPHIHSARVCVSFLWLHLQPLPSSRTPVCLSPVPSFPFVCSCCVWWIQTYSCQVWEFSFLDAKLCKLDFCSTPFYVSWALGNQLQHKLMLKWWCFDEILTVFVGLSFSSCVNTKHILSYLLQQKDICQ